MKLVRDRIPEIIEKSGKVPVYEVLDGSEYERYLNMKLHEEVDEYLESRETEEICDILEVLYAILDLKGVARAEAEEMRQRKARKNGAFRERYLLKEVVVQE